jgi:hypothetical protein
LGSKFLTRRFLVWLHPSLVVGLLGTILFSLALIAHVGLLVRYRTWYFSIIILGAAMEIVGYVFRIMASQLDPYNVIYFVVQYFFIVVAPVFFSAAIYTVISVMINRMGREYAPIPPKVILGTFITCDVVATIMQVAGAAMIGVAESNRKDPNLANHILTAGLAFQVSDFVIFIAILAAFLLKVRKVASPAFNQFSVAVIIATFAIYLRTCFRLAETAEGVLSYASTHEALYSCLELLPIVLAVYIFLWYHPGRWLGSKRGDGKAFQTSNQS